MDRLRNFSEEHIREDCTNITGRHSNGLFYGCRFDKLNGLTLEDCDLNASSFETSKVRDALGFTMTLSCFSFRGVCFSELLFDLFLCLAYMTVGNDLKREKLLDVVGRERAKAILNLLGRIE